MLLIVVFLFTASHPIRWLNCISQHYLSCRTCPLCLAPLRDSSCTHRLLLSRCTCKKTRYQIQAVSSNRLSCAYFASREVGTVTSPNFVCRILTVVFPFQCDFAVTADDLKNLCVWLLPRLYLEIIYLLIAAAPGVAAFVHAQSCLDCSLASICRIVASSRELSFQGSRT